ncbi:MAG: VOC family protein [bacterium]
MKFLHTMVRVSDIEKSLKFYQEVLDMKLDRTKELHGKGATLYFLKDVTGCCEIELTHNHVLPEGGYELGNQFGHFAFEVEDMEVFSTKIKNAGFDFDRPPYRLTEVGSLIAFIKDPDGMMVELIEKKS